MGTEIDRIIEEQVKKWETFEGEEKREGRSPLARHYRSEGTGEHCNGAGSANRTGIET